MSNAARTLEFTCSTANHRNYAVYLPAIQPQYARKVVRTDIKQPLPHGLAANDCNYFNPDSRVFTLSAALYSAGNIGNLRNPPPCMVTKRKRGASQRALVLGDSGGYQIGRGKLKMTPALVDDIFHWLTTYTDAAMTLDVPVWALDSGELVGYRTFDDCLKASLAYLDRFVALGAEKFQFLNVLHGRNLKEADRWYNAVKHYDLSGWALGSSTRHQPSTGNARGLCFAAVLWRLLALLAEGKFERERVWLHFLGVGDLRTALLLTTLKNTLNTMLPDCAVEVSFDTSSPSQASRFLRGVSTYRISPYCMAYDMVSVNKQTWPNSAAPLPFELSTIGGLVSQGDILAHASCGKPVMQTLGYILLENNNVEATVKAIDAAHQLLNYGLTRWELEQLFPYHLLDAMDAIEQVLTQPNLEQAKRLLMSPQCLQVLGNAYQYVQRR